MDTERKWHDLALESLQQAQAEWSRRRTQRLDFIADQMRREGYVVQAFADADEAMRAYYWSITRYRLGASSLRSLPLVYLLTSFLS